MRAAVLALVVGGALLAPELAAAGPVHGRSRDGALEVSGLPDILSRPDVRPHLTTGLTTGLLLTLSGRDPAGRKVLGAARVDVRWEPWDEVFYVTTVAGDGGVRRDTIPSFEKLVAWWSGLVLRVLAKPPSDVSQVQIELSVVPFSQSEQRDAQRWFAGALGPEAADDPPEAGSGSTRLGGVVDLLIATSIQRRSIVRFRWAAEAGPTSSGER